MATVPEGPATAKRRGPLGLGAAAVTLGFIGLGFTFLASFGALLGMAGLFCGIAGWLRARSGRSPGFWWAVWGTLLSLVAVAANLVILNYGTVERWWLGG
jgi:hypothetical protein